MEHSAKYEQITKWYTDGLWSKRAMGNAVKKSWITAEEYEEITGEIYE